MEMNEGICDKIKQNILYREELYSDYATKNDQYLRRKQIKKEEPFIRPPFFRDADRIIHSKAYARYIDKTQVFFLVDNDHITHRVLHVQLVSKIARTIGRALRLNEDLIEAISIGHDIGHVPYGHFGAKILDKLCKKNGIGNFHHNVQSIQFLDSIEDCNLTLQVLDGILCHDGEVHKKIIKPYGNAEWETFDSKLKDIKSGKKGIYPLTMEGCVVRIADTIAYLGRDLQDAIELGLVDKELKCFPKKCIDIFEITDWKKINWCVLDTLIKDVINNSYGKDELSFSDDVSESIADFYKFNMEHVYLNPKLRKESEKIKHMYTILFEQFIEDLNKENKKSLIYPDMYELDRISKEYLDNATPPEIVRDYLAGMTDRYFELIFKKVTIPERVSRYYNGEKK